MLTKLWRHVPNAISSARLLVTPILLFAAVARHETLFKWLLLVCLISDIVDGLIARIFDLRSPLGAFLDSCADMVVLAIALIGLYVFKFRIIAAHWTPLAIIFALYVLEMAIAVSRYGRISSFHTVMVRITAYLQGIFVISLFFWGYVAWIFYAMTAVSMLAYTEELVLLFLLPEWKADVHGIYWVISKRSPAAP